jgi:acyl carrier protein
MHKADAAMGDLRIQDLLDIFGEVVDVSGLNLDESSVIGDDLPVESREMLRVLSRIESRYHFRFQPRELLRVKTLGDLIAAMRRHVPIT